MSTPIEVLFVWYCPKCRSEDLRRRGDHVGCMQCGSWVYRWDGKQLVELALEPITFDAEDRRLCAD